MSLKHFVLILAVAVFAIACQSVDNRENSLVAYLENAELQIETSDQRQELKKALRDILSFSSEQLKNKRYANYRMETGAWTLYEILSAYFLPNKPMSLNNVSFYRDVGTDKAKSIVRKKLTLLQKLDN